MTRKCTNCGAVTTVGEEQLTHCTFCGQQLPVAMSFNGVQIPAGLPIDSNLLSGVAAREIIMQEHEYVTVDNGSRDEFETGSRRDTRKGKGRFDLIWWPMIERLAKLMERGAEKYGERNWELGQPVMRSVDSLIRHVGRVVMREEVEDHLAAIWFNAMSIAYVLVQIKAGKLPAELDDRP